MVPDGDFSGLGITKNNFQTRTIRAAGDPLGTNTLESTQLEI